LKIDALLADARDNGRKSLTEYESKQLLGAYGVPVIDEAVAADAGQAATTAAGMGYPVVLKGLGAKLLHKTEMGLVHLNLADETALRAAAADVEETAGADLEGFLIQPQVAGRRELVAGLFRDPQFGPVVMFGIGGVFTEAFRDVSFRLAPLTRADAGEMLDEIQGKKLLGPFRGELPADRYALIQTLTGLSQIAAEHPEIMEIDVNPLLVSPDGRIQAVDALCLIGDPPSGKAGQIPIKPADIGALFYPRSIAFVGASAQMGKWGNMLLANTVSGGFQGEIYLVNPKGGTIAGKTVYPSVSEIPGHVDLAVVTIPAALVMGLIPQFAEKGIRNMLLITSGFGETGADGKSLEAELVTAARKAGVLVLGPNTMGICNPHIQLYATGTPVTPLPGSTAVVAQSGNMGTQLLAFAENQAIGIRAFCGSGNEAMITIEDYMDGFEVDRLTRIVMLYIESVKDGRRFFESACRVGKKKPIVLLKGGQSAAGNMAASSHTGAMASDAGVFDAVCRQAGIVKVENPTDLLDLSAAFSSLPLPRGNRAAIMTLGGGWGVVTADLCAAFGLDVPALPNEMIARIDEILPPYWSRANPIDIVGENDTRIPLFVMEELLKWDGCDGVINLGIMGRRIFVNRMADAVEKADPDHDAEIVALARQTLTDFETHYIEQIVRLMETYGKPVYGVSLLTEPEDNTVYRVEGSDLKGLFYETPERAVKAFAKMVEYHRFLERGRSCS
jgi:acyl-CoA synthetase (NDP forming)